MSRPHSDGELLDALESFVNDAGALVIHDGHLWPDRSRLGIPPGLGLRHGKLVRSLRDALENLIPEGK